MELQVTFTLSDRLFVLLEDKLPNLGRRVDKAITKELGAQICRESGIAVSVSAGPAAPEQAESEKPRRTRRTKADAPETAAPVTATEEVPETPQPAVESALVAESPVQQSEKTLGEMIREIMHRTRQRFEGEDYKENADSEAYKKYHRAMTSQFKQIAISLGYEKPSYIDTAEKVEAFAAECDALIIDENGFIAFPPAPY